MNTEEKMVLVKLADLELAMDHAYKGANCCGCSGAGDAADLLVEIIKDATAAPAHNATGPQPVAYCVGAVPELGGEIIEPDYSKGIPVGESGPISVPNSCAYNNEEPGWVPPSGFKIKPFPLTEGLPDYLNKDEDSPRERWNKIYSLPNRSVETSEQSAPIEYELAGYEGSSGLYYSKRAAVANGEQVIEPLYKVKK